MIEGLDCLSTGGSFTGIYSPGNLVWLCILRTVVYGNTIGFLTLLLLGMESSNLTIIIIIIRFIYTWGMCLIIESLKRIETLWL